MPHSNADRPARRPRGGSVRCTRLCRPIAKLTILAVTRPLPLFSPISRPVRVTGFLVIAHLSDPALYSPTSRDGHFDDRPLLSLAHQEHCLATQDWCVDISDAVYSPSSSALLRIQPLRPTQRQSRRRDDPPAPLHHCRLPHGSRDKTRLGFRPCDRLSSLVVSIRCALRSSHLCSSLRLSSRQGPVGCAL
jgi:hypothetical protein